MLGGPSCLQYCVEDDIEYAHMSPSPVMVEHFLAGQRELPQQHETRTHRTSPRPGLAMLERSLDWRVDRRRPPGHTLCNLHGSQVKSVFRIIRRAPTGEDVSRIFVLAIHNIGIIILDRAVSNDIFCYADGALAKHHKG